MSVRTGTQNQASESMLHTNPLSVKRRTSIRMCVWICICTYLHAYVNTSKISANLWNNQDFLSSKILDICPLKMLCIFNLLDDSKYIWSFALAVWNAFLKKYIKNCLKNIVIEWKSVRVQSFHQSRFFFWRNQQFASVIKLEILSCFNNN